MKTGAHMLEIVLIFLGCFQLGYGEDATEWKSGPPEGLPKLVGFDVECGKEDMDVHLHFNSPYDGTVYSKGSGGSRGEKCIHVAPRSHVDKASFTIRYDACGTRSDTQGKYYENTIILQYDDDVIEAWDEAKKIRCEWHDGYEKSAFKTPITISDLDVVEMNFQGDDVDCWLEIQDGKGPWSSKVSGLVPLGSPLTLVVAIQDEEHQFDMRVKECKAHDGIHHPVYLTDEDGCVLRPKMMSPFRKTKDTKGAASVVVYSHFYAFKFPETVDVHVQCTVEICRHGCPESCIHSRESLTQGNSEPTFSTAPVDRDLENIPVYRDSNSFSSVVTSKPKSNSAPSDDQFYSRHGTTANKTSNFAIDSVKEMIGASNLNWRPEQYSRDGSHLIPNLSMDSNAHKIFFEELGFKDRSDDGDGDYDSKMNYDHFGGQDLDYLENSFQDSGDGKGFQGDERKPNVTKRFPNSQITKNAVSNDDQRLGILLRDPDYKDQSKELKEAIHQDPKNAHAYTPVSTLKEIIFDKNGISDSHKPQVTTTNNYSDVTTDGNSGTGSNKNFGHQDENVQFNFVSDDNKSSNIYETSSENFSLQNEITDDTEIGNDIDPKDESLEPLITGAGMQISTISDHREHTPIDETSVEADSDSSVKRLEDPEYEYYLDVSSPTARKQTKMNDENRNIISYKYQQGPWKPPKPIPPLTLYNGVPLHYYNSLNNLKYPEAERYEYFVHPPPPYRPQSLSVYGRRMNKIRKRRDIREMEQLGLRQMFQVIAPSDLAYPAKEDESFRSITESDNIPGVCMTSASFAAGLGLIILANICVLCVSVFFAHHYYISRQAKGRYRAPFQNEVLT